MPHRIRRMVGGKQEEARRNAALEKLRTATDPAEIKRLQDELAQIEAAVDALGEEDA
jgi:hypothetical protein